LISASYGVHFFLTPDFKHFQNEKSQTSLKYLRITLLLIKLFI